MQKKPFKNPPAPEAVLLDLDGIVYPFDHHYKAAVRRAAARVLRRAPLTYFNGIAGRLQEHCQRHGVHHRHAPTDLARLVDRTRHDLKADFITANPPLVKAVEALGQRVYILSNSPHSWIDAVLQRRGLHQAIPPTHRFSAPRDAGLSKRYPQCYTAIMKRLPPGISTMQVMLIDDDASNLLAANGAGLQTLHIGRHNHKNSPADSYIDYHCSDTVSAVRLVTELRETQRLRQLAATPTPSGM